VVRRPAHMSITRGPAGGIVPQVMTADMHRVNKPNFAIGAGSVRVSQPRFTAPDNQPGEILLTSGPGAAHLVPVRS
jgi:hypothetical protein